MAGHNPRPVTFTLRPTPSAVSFTERSAAATASLEPLTTLKNSDGWWLFLSGLADGETFTKTSASWQLLAGLKAVGATQRMGKLDTNGFVLLIEDNA